MVNPTNKIISGITSQMNENLKFEVNLIQPQYLLHRDTIQSFFYEKKERLESSGKALAYFGMFLSTSISLLTSTFNDFWILNSNVLQVIFVSTAAISLVLFCKHLFFYLKYRSELEVTALTNELGKRSTFSMINEKT